MKFFWKQSTEYERSTTKYSTNYELFFEKQTQFKPGFTIDLLQENPMPPPDFEYNAGFTRYEPVKVVKMVIQFLKRI